MNSPHSLRTGSQDSVDGIRKRVCKACDRCRLKKSKCDGANPCSRCRTDNAICVFGERKKSHDKVYPKGYVEMLEQQQTQLVSGLQEMYRKLAAAKAWEGPTLSEASGQPLTHDILAALHLLETKHDGSGEVENFEEDCQKLQSKLLDEGAGYVHRRGSFSSESEHSQHGQQQPPANQRSPPASKPAFKENFNFDSASSSPLTQSPVPQHRQYGFPPAQPSPLQQGFPLASDPQFYRAEWAFTDANDPEQIRLTRLAMQAPDLQQQQHLNSFDASFAGEQFEAPPAYCDAANNFGSLPVTCYPQQMSNAFVGTLPGMQQDFGLALDPMDLDFQKFIQVST